MLLPTRLGAFQIDHAITRFPVHSEAEIECIEFSNEVDVVAEGTAPEPQMRCQGAPSANSTLCSGDHSTYVAISRCAVSLKPAVGNRVHLFCCIT